MESRPSTSEYDNYITRVENLTAPLHITSVLHDSQTYGVFSAMAVLVLPDIPEIESSEVD